MKYKVGNTITCNVKTYPDGKRKIINHKPDKDDQITKEKFQIIWIDEMDRQYIIAIDPNMIGWNLSEWHQIYWDIDKKYLKMKYYQIPMEEENGN